MKLRYAALTAALAVSGCAKEPLQIGSVYVKSLLIRASEGGRMVVDSTDHGTLAGAGVVVEANALSQDTTVTVEVGDANLGDTDGENVGPSVKFGPADVTFSTPARVSIPYDGTYDEDLARVWVAAADGGRRVLLPTDLSYDATLGTVTFSTTSFASYRSGRARRACSHVQCDRDECRRGACVPLPTCDESACGARPGVPSWTCSDGSDGGSTGRCIRQVDGTCGWEIIWCPKECQTTECGPAPTRGVVFCDDGSVQGPVCTRNTRGICAWQTPSCNLGCEPVSCGTPPAELPSVCRDGGYGGPVCMRRDGEDRCRWQIQRCPHPCRRPDNTSAPNCTETLCDNVICPRGTRCNPETGACTREGQSCGSTVCGADQICCNMSCGICVAPTESCTDQTCVECGARTCPPEWTCRMATSQAECMPPTCDDAMCGTPLDFPQYRCEDGTLGGPTGRCVRQRDNSCRWEVRNCTRACREEDCPRQRPMNTCTTGMTATSVCRRATSGRCSWVVLCR